MVPMGPPVDTGVGGRPERTSRVSPGRAFYWLGLGLAIGGLLSAGAFLGRPLALAAQEQAQADITVDQLHIFLVPTGESVRVSEYYLLGNSGDSTYTGGAQDRDPEGHPAVTVVFPLPEAASNVHLDQVGDYDRYLLLENAIADTQPISPGVATVEARFAYDLPLGATPTFTHTVPLPVQSAVILVVGDAWELQGPILMPMGAMEAGGQRAQAYTLGPLEAGDTIAFSVVATAASTEAGAVAGTEVVPVVNRRGSGTLGVVWGVLAVAVAAIAAVGLWRARPPAGKRPQGVPPQGVPPQGVPEAVQRLVGEIAELDRRFDAGEVDEAMYRAARDARKADIHQLVQQRGQSESGNGTHTLN